ncbi:MAG TPA: VOC family protein [Dongiaceae bacterium]|nr:VOC family protein [Dongiaceae bacterium]
MDVIAYLFFEGRTEEALDFYQRALGAKVEAIHRYKESPEPGHAPAGAENKVMHATFTVGDTTIMASDGNCQGKPDFKGVSLSLNVGTEAEAERFFAALSEGGQVQVPLTKTFFAPRFGMVADRVGVSWMVHVRPNA